MKKNYVCEICKNEDISRDCYETWDIESQTWIFQRDYDLEGFCGECDTQVQLIEIEIPD